MIKPPYTKWINDIKTKLGFNRTMTASGADVVDAVNKQSQQIEDLGPYNGLDSDSIIAALSAAQGKALKGLIDGITPIYTNGGLTIISSNVASLTSYTIRIGNVLIINAIFTVNGTINDGDILFQLSDLTIVFNRQQVNVITIQASQPKTIMVNTVANDRTIKAWSTLTLSNATWTSFTFIVPIREV